jgi:predicted metal-dependent HD superfamily phosphohydrolase
MKNELRQRWETVFPEHEDVYHRIIEHYEAPWRVYHNRSHLEAVFQVLDNVFPAHQHDPAVNLALWFHDFIYEPCANGCEAMSANVLRFYGYNTLDLSPAVVEDAAVAVRETDYLKEPSTLISMVVSDCDLAILSEPDAVFKAYEAAVRAEYSMVSDPMFQAGRTGILRSFLRKEHIYSRDEMRDRERQARINVGASLHTLEKAVL